MKRESLMLCLIQCGETTWHADGRVQGAMDLPLSDAGRGAVMAELQRLKPSTATTIYHPSDEAATDTAGICARQISAKTRAIPELADPHMGLLEGVTEEEFSERFPTRFKQWEEDLMSLAPPEGEEIMLAADRIYRAVAKLLRRSKSDEVAVVLHPLSLAMLRCWLADWPLHDVRMMLSGRPRIERYALPLELLAELEVAAATAFVKS